MSKKSGGFVLGTLIGAATASLAALFLAPKSGQELRKDLAGYTDKYKDLAKEYKEIALDKSQELAKVAKEKTAQIKEQVAGQVEDLKAKLAEATSSQPSLEESLEDGKDQVIEVTANLVNQAQDATAEGLKEANEVLDEAKDNLEEA